jgi:hypothetical protein
MVYSKSMSNTSNNKPVETVDAFVLQECIRIANDVTESVERRRKASAWAKKLVESAGSNWEGGGRTVAEKAGVEVDPKAPGGQRVDSGSGYAGVSRNSGRVADIEAGQLSSELHSGQRVSRG